MSCNLVFFSCATTGRAEHGTRRTTPHDAPFCGDYYRNLTEEDVRSECDLTAFKQYEFSTNESACDLYFWGIKWKKVCTPIFIRNAPESRLVAMSVCVNLAARVRLWERLSSSQPRPPENLLVKTCGAAFLPALFPRQLSGGGFFNSSSSDSYSHNSK